MKGSRKTRLLAEAESWSTQTSQEFTLQSNHNPSSLQAHISHKNKYQNLEIISLCTENVV